MCAKYKKKRIHYSAGEYYSSILGHVIISRSESSRAIESAKYERQFVRSTTTSDVEFIG